MMAKKVMFDSNMFDEIVDGNITKSELDWVDASYYATPVQQQELEDASGQRGKKLLHTFQLVTEDVKDSVFEFDTQGAGWGDGAWASENQLKISENIKREHASGEKEDVNIATVAVSNDLMLVTADKRLQNALDRTYPDSFLTRDEFISKLGS